MFYYLLRYDFFTVSRTEFAILLLASGLVIGGEMINSGIEKADDSVSKEKKHSIEVSKDVSAGAVLVFAIFAVLCGIAILWQPEAFRLLFNHYSENQINILWFVLSVVAFTIFIFKFDFKK
jgi:diacylglycerol kinase